MPPLRGPALLSSSYDRPAVFLDHDLIVADLDDAAFIHSLYSFFRFDPYGRSRGRSLGDGLAVGMFPSEDVANRRYFYQEHNLRDCVRAHTCVRACAQAGVQACRQILPCL